jgi:hypothetical protein
MSYMSFNKRYFNKDYIIKRYRHGGADDVISSFTKIDGCIYEDSFSSQIADAVYEKDIKLIDRLIQNEISMTIEQATKALFELYENQIMDLTVISKIELGDDVISEIKRLKNIINEHN